MSQKTCQLWRCSFDKHGLFLINSISTLLKMILLFNFPCPLIHFYLLYLLLNIWDGSDAFWHHCVKQSSSFSRKHRTLSLQICVRQTIRLPTDCGLMQERVCIVQTPVRDTSRCDTSCWSSASLTRGQATSILSQNVIDKISPCRNNSLPKLARFLRHNVVLNSLKLWCILSQHTSLQAS